MGQNGVLKMFGVKLNRKEAIKESLVMSCDENLRIKNQYQNKPRDRANVGDGPNTDSTLDNELLRIGKQIQENPSYDIPLTEHQARRLCRIMTQSRKDRGLGSDKVAE